MRTALTEGLRWLATNNPRSIKRFANLYRFYTFMAQQRSLTGEEPDAPPPDAMAKLAALAIQWPRLLGMLMVRSEDRDCVLSELEDIARQSSAADGDSEANGNADSAAWLAALVRYGALDETGEPSVSRPCNAVAVRPLPRGPKR
jgi:hypothetical protein